MFLRDQRIEMIYFCDGEGSVSTSLGEKVILLSGKSYFWYSCFEKQAVVYFKKAVVFLRLSLKVTAGRDRARASSGCFKFTMKGEML